MRLAPLGDHGTSRPGPDVRWRGALGAPGKRARHSRRCRHGRERRPRAAYSTCRSAHRCQVSTAPAGRPAELGMRPHACGAAAHRHGRMAAAQRHALQSCCGHRAACKAHHGLNRIYYHRMRPLGRCARAPAERVALWLRRGTSAAFRLVREQAVRIICWNLVDHAPLMDVLLSPNKPLDAHCAQVPPPQRGVWRARACANTQTAAL